MSQASPDDVVARLGQTLSDVQRVQCQVLLDDLELEITRRIPETNPLWTDPKFLARVVTVESRVMARYYDNTDGYISESSEGYAYTGPNVGLTGFRASDSLTASDWSLLGLQGKIWSLVPQVSTPAPRWHDPDPAMHYGWNAGYW